jgi:hypothetical protein
MVYEPYESSIDGPTEADVYARYYGVAPEGPGGEHTITLSFRSSDGKVFTHDFYATSVEEIQLGLGNEAKLYDLDPMTGELSPSSGKVMTEVPGRAHYEELFDSFAR